MICFMRSRVYNQFQLCLWIRDYALILLSSKVPRTSLTGAGNCRKKVESLGVNSRHVLRIKILQPQIFVINKDFNFQGLIDQRLLEIRI